MIILSAKVTPQELEFLKGTQIKKIGDDKKSADAFEMAALQLKAQSLMDKFTDSFTAQNRIETYNKQTQAAQQQL